MAAKNKKEEEQEEPKIPVFTVIKNGAILKNIFIVNNNNNNNSCPSSELNEQILIIGRHPDCNVMLTHPSISRFHLKIISNPSSQNLSVIDLSSVHGTWVSEKKIEPWVRVDINEGDSLRIGGSSRVYRLHWIPLSHAYNFETPYVSASDEPMEEEREDYSGVEGFQDENSMPIENNPVEEEEKMIAVEIKEKEEKKDDNSLFPDLVSEDLICFFSDENSGITVKKEIPSAPPIPENLIYSLFDEDEEGVESPLKDVGEEKEVSICCDEEPLATKSEKLSSAVDGISSENKLLGYDIDTQSSEPSFVTETGCEKESPEISSRGLENQSPLNVNIFGRDHSLEPQNLSSFNHGIGLTERSAFLVEDVFVGSEDQHGGVKYQSPEAVHDVETPSQKTKQVISSVDHKPNLLADFESAFSDEALEETEELKATTKDDELRGVSNAESVNSSLPESVEVEQNQTPRSRCATEGMAMRSDTRPSSGSIWLSRGKSANSIELQTGKSREENTLGGVDSEDKRRNDENIFSGVDGKEDETFTSDTENFTPNRFRSKSLKREDKLIASDYEKCTQDNTEGSLVLKENLSSVDGKEEDIFTPDKENLTPNTFLGKSSKKGAVLDEVKYSKRSSSSPLKVTCGPSTRPEDYFAETGRNGNQVSRVLQELKPVKKQSTSGKKVSLERELLVNRKRQERVPFQSLHEESDGKSRPQARSSLSASHTRTEEKTIINPVSNNPVQQIRKAWTMVADATTLLNKRSRKNLQLLQGVKQARLVIPRMVIRELDGMKQRGGLFKRKSEACLVLEWIEQCLVKTSSWIHVQSSAEDGRLTAPTPPTSPWTPFLRHWSLMEIVSPTTEDHILECALTCRKMNIDRQVVLLSDDVSLKVKAMAEGMLCEAAQEFRESLVSPFSDRFLWADSSPRGQTWSFADDVVLGEKYDRCPLKRQFKGVSAKGLKLILLHNSHYGQRTPVS